MNLSFNAFKLTALAFVMLSNAACAQAQNDTQERQVDEVVASVETNAPDITVTVLGSGTPIPAADQYGAAILVQAGGQDLLFDCGRGCTSRLAQVNRRLITSVEQLFITHLHSDHIVGIDDLWLNGWTQGRDTPLSVYGPSGTKRFFTHLKEAFSEDIGIRIIKGIPATTDGIAMAMTDYDEDAVVYEKDGVKVTAFLVDHQPVEPAFGYRIDYAGRSVVISGDTTFSENLVRNSSGVDVILHEVLSPSMVGYLENNFTEKQVNSVLAIHTTTEQAAEIFAKTKPRLAVYYHTRNSPKDESGLIAVTGETFDGDVVVAKDLTQITIDDEIKTSMVE